MRLKCPEGHEIDVLTPGEIEERFGYTPNQMKRAREKGQIAEPFITLKNTHIYLERDVRAFFVNFPPSRRGKPRVVKAEGVASDFNRLSDQEKLEALETIVKLGEDGQASGDAKVMELLKALKRITENDREEIVGG